MKMALLARERSALPRVVVVLEEEKEARQPWWRWRSGWPRQSSWWPS